MAVKTVELVWSGTHWCDRITGVKIPEGIYPPPDQQAEAIGTTLEEWTGVPSQPNVPPFADARAMTGSDQAALEVLVDRAVELAIKAHTYHTPYFVQSLSHDDDMLVTFAAMHSAIRRTVNEKWPEYLKVLDDEFAAIRRRVTNLERPWYKRWFSR